MLKDVAREIRLWTQGPRDHANRRTPTLEHTQHGCRRPKSGSQQGGQGKADFRLTGGELDRWLQENNDAANETLGWIFAQEILDLNLVPRGLENRKTGLLSRQLNRFQKAYFHWWRKLPFINPTPG
jgi:hypothetical protein